ncbi:neuronal acetylcholine receptor subunit alpha-4-like [Littorina saxatilis]|uniref:neuronal acetylcholine receptor subunit alpha-4-like n=1 Tax=Littorina saxatilis TaxID=31220 RepID=UPI0038B6605E
MTQMVLTSEAKDIDMRHYEEDGEWRLLSTGVTVSPHNISLHPFHADDVTFSRVCFTFSVLRRPRYYMINVLLPCLLLCVLVLINFFLPPDSGEKVSLGITVLLAFTVFQLLIAEVIPTSASETPLLAVYLICIMAMSTLSVIMSVCVLNLHHRTVYSHPPPWLRHLVLHYLARAMYMQISHVTGKIQPVREWKEKEQSSTPNLTTSVSPARRNSANDTKITLTVDEQADKPHSFANPMTSDNVMDCNSDSDSRHIHLRHVLKGRGGSEHRLGGRHGILSREDIAGALKRTAMSERDVTNRSATTTTTTLQPDVTPSYMLPVDSKSAARLMQSINNLSLAGGERDRSRSQLEFIRAVRDVYHELQTTRQAGELEHALVNEWKLIARVVDRLFFWITFLTLMVTTVAVFSVRE